MGRVVPGPARFRGLHPHHRWTATPHPGQGRRLRGRKLRRPRSGGRHAAGERNVRPGGRRAHRLRAGVGPAASGRRGRHGSPGHARLPVVAAPPGGRSPSGAALRRRGLRVAPGRVRLRHRARHDPALPPARSPSAVVHRLCVLGLLPGDDRPWTLRRPCLFPGCEGRVPRGGGRGRRARSVGPADRVRPGDLELPRVRGRARRRVRAPVTGARSRSNSPESPEDTQDELLDLFRTELGRA